MPQGEVLPQVLVFQEFEQTPAELTQPLRALVIGPNYGLLRYPDEKDDISVGQYDPTMDNPFTWPNRPAGAVVDQSFTKVFMEDALLKYFEDLIGADETIEPVGTSKPNQVRCDTLIFKTFGTDEHSTIFKDRGVKVGDAVDLRDASDNTLRSTVVDFINEVVAAVVGSATSDAGNQGATIQSESISQVAGTANDVTEAADGTSYDGLADGDVSETYFAEVIQGSVGGDATTALLRITSASGHDDVASVAPSAFGVATAIGTRGLEATWDHTADDFVVGQRWQIDVTMAFTPPVPTEGGSYSGASDTSYIAEVIEGGLYAANPKIQITTTTGIDASGPHIVTAAATPIAIGTKGVTIEFSGAGLNKGDKYIIPVTAAADGAIRTLVLADTLPTAMQSAVDLEMKLYIKKDVEIDENRTESPPLVNWETAETQITLKSGITTFDSSWTDSGVLEALPVVEGEAFIHYRALLAGGQSAVQTIDNIGEVETRLGTVDPDNPLAFGVYKALENANGTAVKYINVESDDLAGHSEVVNRVLDRRDVYSFVPLTFDAAIQDLYAAHVKALSTAENAGWRILWVSTQGEASEAVATENTDGETILATIIDDPDTAGTQYTIVQASDTLFVDGDEPVRAGDIVRALYTDDGFGNEEYSEFVVDAILANDRLRLVSGPSAGVGTPSKIEVHRNLTKDEIAANIAQVSGTFGHRRLRNVWPDTVGVNDVDVPGYFLAAGLAGLRSGVVPHQGLTNVEIAGFDDLSRTTEFFNDNQLAVMAAAGTWIVTQGGENSLNPGAVFTRHQLTTDTDSIEDAEDTLVTNPDSISYVFYNRLSNFIGRTNVTPSNINRIRTEIFAIIEYLKNAGFSERLGAQLIDAELTRLVRHPLLKDRLVAELDAEVPYPTNNIELKIVFG